MERPFLSNYGTVFNASIKTWLHTKLEALKLRVRKYKQTQHPVSVHKQATDTIMSLHTYNRHISNSADALLRERPNRQYTANKAGLNRQLARLESELALAKRIQTGFLPQVLPSIPGIDLFADSQSAQWVGGDYYDLINLSTEDLILIVGDVSRKGISAALLMAVICKVLRTSLKVLTSPTPKAMLTYANNDMYAEFARTGMFATTFVGHYQAETRKLSYANAGHSPVIYRPATGCAYLLQADGAPVGILETNSCENWELDMTPGDILVAATDGFVEARNPAGDMFGYNRLLALVDQFASRSAEEMATAIFESLSRFGAGKPVEDDRTIVIIKGLDT